MYVLVEVLPHILSILRLKYHTRLYHLHRVPRTFRNLTAILGLGRTKVDAPRSFKTPWVPFVPIAGIVTCLIMMVFLPADTWIRLVIWMLIGLDIYVNYGIKHSKLEHMQAHRKGESVLNLIAILLSVLCVITGLWHQQTVGWNESHTLLIISFLFAFTHLAYYLKRMGKQAIAHPNE